MSHAIHFGDDVLEAERDGQWVYSDLPHPDPKWRATDTNGHEHYWQDGPDRYPTLRLVESEPYWCDTCSDEHTDTWYVCRQCGEKVEPGTRVDTSPKWIGRPTTYLLNGERISNDRANEIITEMQRAADEASRVTSRPPIGTRVRLGETLVTAMPTDAAVPDDQVTVMFHGTGDMENVPLERLRKVSP